MIHQLIFANPKLGMSAKEFQDYWINVHAVEYASKISQIKKYIVNRVLQYEYDESPIFWGIAEIWLENEMEQLASLQSDEFIHGARADEPKWAAFWRSVCLDTDSFEQVLCEKKSESKLLILVKRKEGLSLEVFRRYCRDIVGNTAQEIPNLRQYTLNLVKDNFYSIGESYFDAVFQLWFDDQEEVRSAEKTGEFQKMILEINEITNPRYRHYFHCQENRIR